MNKWRALKAKAIFLFEQWECRDAKAVEMDGKEDEEVPSGLDY